MNSPHKGQWRGALMFSLICIWINGWVNKDEGGDLRRHRAHNDVIVMDRILTWYWMGNKPLSKQIHWLPLVIRRQRFILNIVTVTKQTWHVGKIIDLLTWFYLISVSVHDIPQKMHPVHALLCFVWVKCRYIYRHPLSSFHWLWGDHGDVIMSAMAYRITSLAIVCSTVYSDADQSRHQRSASLALVRGIPRRRWISRTKASDAELWCFFYLRLNKR